jgi:hypothetical protein
MCIGFYLFFYRSTKNSEENKKTQLNNLPKFEEANDDIITEDFEDELSESSDKVLIEVNDEQLESTIKL